MSYSPIYQSQDTEIIDNLVVASASQIGDERDATRYFERTLESKHLAILNDYPNPLEHSDVVDLNSYALDGWSLYNVKIDIETIIAEVEKEVVGVIYESDFFQISEQAGTFYSKLAQGFYAQPHDGILLNYSINYATDGYIPSVRGNASFSIYSNYSTSSPITSPVNMTASEGVLRWVTIPGENANLLSNQKYWAIIDGSQLQKAGPLPRYPIIIWAAEGDEGLFESYKRGISTWIEMPLEAVMRYSYIPWNQTTDSELVFASPLEIDLKVNSTDISSDSFEFSSMNTNLLSLSFETNQSVNIDYNITLSYRKDDTTSTYWAVSESGGMVEWNSTIDLDYPQVTGLVTRFLNISKPYSWTIAGLYNSTSPAVNYGHYTIIGTMVKCNDITNGSWILKASSFNHLTALHTYDSSDDSLTTMTSILTDLDVNITLQEDDNDSVVSGHTYLTIFRQGSAIWSPDNVSVASGKAHYLWNIDTTTSDNGVFSIEALWANGTDAGYLSRDLIVYYPTSLTASAPQVDGFTDSSFEIRVHFQDTFTPHGLDGDSAYVIYSFDGGLNASMTDLDNGTWTASVSTAGKAPGSYTSVLYAEGYALENRSCVIHSTLIHDTESLAIQWSNGDNISYVQTTDLLVQYRRIGGTAITDATVNVTIDETPFPLKWDSELGLYRITFNGTDAFSGLGTYTLLIQAWKDGYEGQSDSSYDLTLHEEYTVFSVQWLHGTNITYVEYTVLTVTYQMSNTSAIPFAAVNVTDGLTTWTLKWNGTDGTYWIRFNGTDSNPGFGTHPLIIRAGKQGYENHEDAGHSLILRWEPTSLTLAWSDGSTITYIQQTILTVNYTMSNGSPVIGATVNVTIGLGFWQLDYNPATETYDLALNGSDVLPGFGAHSVTVLAGKWGFDGKTNDTEYFTANLESTSLTITWSMGFNITFVQQTTLTVAYKMNDGTPIAGARVNVTINGQLWNMIWDGSTFYVLAFNGSDSPPGLGIHDLTILAGEYGFVNQVDNTENLVLREEPTSISTEWIDLSVITYVESTTISINYTMSDGSPITGAVVYVTINTTTWNLTWDSGTETYRQEFFGDDELPGLGIHTLFINASRFGFVTAFDGSILVIQNEPTTLIVQWIPTNNITYTSSCILSISYLMNSNNSAITSAMVIATFDGIARLLDWNSTAQTYYLLIDGDVDLSGFGTFPVSVTASRYGFDSTSDSLQEMILRTEPSSLLVRWANEKNNPDFFSYSYLIVEYTYGSNIAIIDAKVNVTIGAHTWALLWNQTEGYYQLRFNGSDPVPGVGTHSLIVRAWEYGFIEQINGDEELTLPVIPTLLDLVWTNGDTITYVQKTTLQAFYRMYNDTWITDAIVNATINGVTLPLVWNSVTHSYERTFSGIDGALDFTTYPILVVAHQADFQSQTSSDESLTKQLEPTGLVISWIGGNNITYFSETRLSAQFIMSNSSPITTGVLNATINGYLWSLIWNGSSFAYETLIHGNDPRLHYATFDVVVNASSFGYVPAMASTEKLTIRPEDTYVAFDWVPSNTISYLDVTVFRIYYRYLNGSPVLTATVNASYVWLWEATYNGSSGAYEIAFTGADMPSPALGPHTFLVLASEANHLAHSDISQTLTIVQEDTSIQASWLDGDYTITYVESATLFINYSMTENGLPVIDAFVTIRIGTHTWVASYNVTLKLYTYTFTGNMDPPGLGTFVLYISATYLLHEGYKDATDNSRMLVILSESVDIHSYWIEGGTITYVGSTILVVNYTMSNGSAISSALVNVTIGLHYWDLAWNEASQTYRLVFNGSDPLPGLGYHELEIRAGRDGFDSLSDSTLSLEIVQEPTMLTPRWSDPHQDTITYFECTYLFVEYSMSNGSPILDASVNVTIDLLTLKLYWNATEGAYGIRFNGSDIVPGFGTHNLVIVVSKYGFILAQDPTETLEVRRDPTTIQVSWLSGSSISFVESTTLMVYYRMSNGSPVPSAIVGASIGSDSWPLTWNASAQAYCFTFTGNMDPPGIGSSIVDIEASGTVYIDQSTSTALVIREEPTSANASWISETLDWTENIVLEVEYRDSYGRLIEEAILKTITVDGVPYTLRGASGVYWFEFNNTFDLGHHLVVVNISKYGYEFATNSSISIDIIEAATSLELLWSATTIDYLGQIDLSANYSYAGTGDIVPQGGVIANITIDGSITLPLIESGDFFVVSLSGVYLDLGPHSIIVRAQAYGYSFAESAEILTVNQVMTNTLSITWTPLNLTIEFTDSLNVVVDYTFYDGDVPNNATVNVTINGQVYSLLYSSGAWRTSISGNQIGIGIFDASINAWLYGYALQSHVTTGLNVTLAANSFIVTWQPSSLAPTYVDIINVSVMYTQDYAPILGASVRLSINSTMHELTYSSLDMMWHFSIRATVIGLGAWNVTVTANRTGFADGWYCDTLIVLPATTILDVSVLSSSLYYDEATIVYIFYEMSNSSYVPDATLNLTILGIEQAATWEANHWTVVLHGAGLGIGVHNLTIAVSALGFVDQYGVTTIGVLPIPTEMAYSPICIAYAQDDIILGFSYLDSRTSAGIPGALFFGDWIGSYNVTVLGNGTYLMQIGGSSLHAGNYTFNITLQCTGYQNGTGQVEIEIESLPTELLLDSQISQYENETIIIQARFLDEAHSVSIDWAVIIATLEGVQYFLLYDASTQNYTLSIQLPSDISPGIYNISITANGVDCDSKEGAVELDVLPKSTYVLTLEVADEIETGSGLVISAIVQHNGQPVGGIPLTLFVMIIPQNDSPHDSHIIRIHTQIIETDSAGVATYVFYVPVDAASLGITVQYAGSISVWPAESEASAVLVRTGELGLLDMILRDPVLLSIVVGCASVPIASLALMRRRRSHADNIKASIETSGILASTETISVVGPIDKMKERVSASESGITRAELSKYMGISSSKTGILVKDLLDSDSSFYELREGTRRLIKKREP